MEVEVEEKRKRKLQACRCEPVRQLSASAGREVAAEDPLRKEGCNQVVRLIRYRTCLPVAPSSQLHFRSSRPVRHPLCQRTTLPDSSAVHPEQRCHDTKGSRDTRKNKSAKTSASRTRTRTRSATWRARTHKALFAFSFSNICNPNRGNVLERMARRNDMGAIAEAVLEAYVSQRYPERTLSNSTTLKPNNAKEGIEAQAEAWESGGIAKPNHHLGAVSKRYDFGEVSTYSPIARTGAAT